MKPKFQAKTEDKTETKIKGYLNGFNYGMEDAHKTGIYKNPRFSDKFGDKSARIGYSQGFNTYESLKFYNFIGSNPSEYYLPEIMNSPNDMFKITNFEDVQRYYNIYKKIDILDSSDDEKKQTQYMTKKPRQPKYISNKRNHLEKILAYNKERIINYKDFSKETNLIHHIKYNKNSENFEITPTISDKDIFKSSLIYFISNPIDVNSKIKQELIYISYSDFNLDLKNILPSSIKREGNDICFEYDEDPQNFFDFLVEINGFFKENYMKEKLKDFIIVTSDNHSFWISIIIPFCLLFNELTLKDKSIIFKCDNMRKNGHLIYNGDILEYFDEKNVYRYWTDPIIDENNLEIRAILSFTTNYLISNQHLIKQTNNQILNFIKIINSSYLKQIISFIRGDSNYETNTDKNLFIDYHKITLQHNNINYDYLFKHGIRGKLDGRSYELFCINFDTTEKEIIKKMIYADILHMYKKNINTNLPMSEFIKECEKQIGNLLNNKRVVIYGHNLDYLLVNMVLRNANYSRYIKKVHYPDDPECVKRSNWFLTQTTLFYPKYFLRDSEPGTILYHNPIGFVLDAQNEMINEINNDPLNIINAICLDNIRAQTYSLTDMKDKKFYGSKLNLSFNMSPLIKSIIVIFIILIVIVIIVIIVLICDEKFKKNSFEPN